MVGGDGEEDRLAVYALVDEGVCAHAVGRVHDVDPPGLQLVEQVLVVPLADIHLDLRVAEAEFREDVGDGVAAKFRVHPHGDLAADIGGNLV